MNEYRPCVVAIRIYNKYGHQSVADLRLNDGSCVTIDWCKPAEREKYFINGYTLIYDTRPKRRWNEWLNKT